MQYVNCLRNLLNMKWLPQFEELKLQYHYMKTVWYIKKVITFQFLWNVCSFNDCFEITYGIL